MAGLELFPNPALAAPANWYQQPLGANDPNDPPSWGNPPADSGRALLEASWSSGSYLIEWGNGPAVPGVTLSAYLIVNGAAHDGAVTALAVAVATTQLVTSAYSKDEQGHEYYGALAGDAAFASGIGDESLVESVNAFRGRLALDGWEWWRQYANGAYQQYLAWAEGQVSGAEQALNIAPPPNPGPTTQPTTPLADDGWRRLTHSVSTTTPSAAYSVRQIGGAIRTAMT